MSGHEPQFAFNRLYSMFYHAFGKNKRGCIKDNEQVVFVFEKG